MSKFRLMLGVSILLALAASVLATPPKKSPPKDVPYKLVIDRRTVKVNPGAFMRGNTTYVPLKATATELNSIVSFDKKKNSYTIRTCSSATTIPTDKVVTVEGTALAELSITARALKATPKIDRTHKTINLTGPPPTSGG